MVPDFLTIGHACHDTAPSGYVPGGAVTYSGLFARKLGLKTAVLTSLGDDYLFRSLFEQIDLHIIPAEQTTVFQNQYVEGGRLQHLLARANTIQTKHLPSAWNQAPMVLLGPIANEVDFDFLNVFQQATVCISPQGWMRQWDAEGRVFRQDFQDTAILKKADITIISLEDVNGDEQKINEWSRLCQILVVTRDAEGCTVYEKGKETHIEAIQTKVVDATGAGDTFATAFLRFYAQSKNSIRAAQLANVAASYCIEKKGIEGLPTEEQILFRYKQNYT